MQIIIDIPDEMIESIENGSFGAKYNIYELCGVTVNGIPLPKNHGRLIDADALMVYCRNQKSRTIDCNDIARFPTTVPRVMVESEEYQAASEMRDYCEEYEPTYNSEDGSM